MSTKTWQEKFEEEFWGKFGSTKTINEIKQFLSQAINQTREETIREVLNKMRDVETKYTGDVFTDNMIDNILIDYHHKLKSLINLRSK